MSNSMIAVTEKVMRLFKSMVYMAMRVSYRKGATTEDISTFLEEWAPSQNNIYHTGVIERVLGELQRDGMVARAGARWYPLGLAR